MKTTREEWRASPSVEGLVVSSWGRIRCPAFYSASAKRWYESRPWYGCKVHKPPRYVTRFRGRTYKVHVLVCEAFNGPKPDGKPYCLHRDEDGWNNVPGNLYWGTQKENLNAPGFIAYCKARTGENNPVIKGRLKREAAIHQ